MVRNRQSALLIGAIAALFLLSIICCSGIIIVGTMFSESKREPDSSRQPEGGKRVQDEGKTSFPDDDPGGILEARPGKVPN